MHGSTPRIGWRRSLACLVAFVLILGAAFADGDPPPVKRGKGGGWVVLPKVAPRPALIAFASVDDSSGGIYLELDPELVESCATVSYGNVPAVMFVSNGLLLPPSALEAVAGSGAPTLDITFLKLGVGQLHVRLIHESSPVGEGHWEVQVQ